MNNPPKLSVRSGLLTPQQIYELRRQQVALVRSVQPRFTPHIADAALGGSYVEFRTGRSASGSGRIPIEEARLAQKTNARFR